ncbi:hypothetical protein SFRURICE_018498 [Spodoptera frugiperda]|nr:hypothetical protein SFRURICE_018498 [Spodoptera frugiperda]
MRRLMKDQALVMMIIPPILEKFTGLRLKYPVSIISQYQKPSDTDGQTIAMLPSLHQESSMADLTTGPAHSKLNGFNKKRNYIGLIEWNELQE